MERIFPEKEVGNTDTGSDVTGSEVRPRWWHLYQNITSCVVLSCQYGITEIPGIIDLWNSALINKAYLATDYEDEDNWAHIDNADY